MSDDSSFGFCGKTQPEVRLKKCAKCMACFYCSRICQKADWKDHKKVCGKMAGSQQPSSSSSADPPENAGWPGPSPPRGLDLPITKPFTRLDSGTWLHDRPERDVYRLLIDVHRLRIEDEYVFQGVVRDDTLYDDLSRPDLLRGFRHFLQCVAARPGLLPPWWSPGKQAECETLAMDSTQWHCLLFEVHKSDILEHYGDTYLPMQLRMFGRDVYQCFPGPGDSAKMKAHMMSIEQRDGTEGGEYMVNICYATRKLTNLRV